MDGHEFADKKLRGMAKEIQALYAQAAKEAEERLAKFLDTFNAADEERREAVKAGKLSEKAYKAWRQKEFMTGEKYIAVRDSLAEQMADSAQLVVAAINGHMPEVYAENLNYSHFMCETGTGFNLAFDLVNADALQVLATHGHRLVPEADFVRNKCVSWNKRQIAGQIGIGILLGEPIPAIAKRMSNVTGMNAKNSIRTARTLTTAAENAGVLKGFHDAQKIGVRMKQEWLATLDGRTRDSHRHVDGEKVEVGGKFSNGCRMPGDPEAPYSETANCRCTLVAAVDGVSTDDAERWSKLPDGMSYEQWRGKRSEVTNPKPFEWVGGNATKLEIFQSPEYMTWVNERAKQRYLEASEQVTTYSELSEYMKKRGIRLDTTSKKLREIADRQMPKAVKEQADQILAALCQYDEMGGLKGLRAIHIWHDQREQGTYYYKALDEGRVDEEREIFFKNGNIGMGAVMHEFAHAYADLSKPRGHDCATWSAELNRLAHLPDDASAYSGAESSDSHEAELFADAFRSAFGASSKENAAKYRAFVERVAVIVKQRKES